MALILHIVIALTSLALTSFLFFKPSQTGMNTAYGLVAATLLSGTYLVASTGSHILSACVSGLVYLAAVSFGLVLARQRLAKQKTDD